MMAVKRSRDQLVDWLDKQHQKSERPHSSFPSGIAGGDAKGSSTVLKVQG